MGKRKNDSKKRRSKVRKGRLAICLLPVFALLAAVFVILLKTKLFPVKSIKAGGSELYTSEEIIAAAGITDKTPIFSISAAKIEKVLHSKLPYIETVSIKRVFPDAVEIAVSDASEYFAFENGDKYFVAGENCRILNVYEEMPENLIKVIVPDADYTLGEEVAFKSGEQSELFTLLADYAKKKGIKLNSIDLSDMLHIKIGVADKFEVLLGTKENIREKLDHLAGMINGIGERKGKINLEMWSKTDTKGTFIAEN